MLEKCASGSYDAMQQFINNFSAEGFSVSQFLNQLHERIIFSTELSSKQKNLICEKLAVKSILLNCLHSIYYLSSTLKFIKFCYQLSFSNFSSNSFLFDLDLWSSFGGRGWWTSSVVGSELYHHEFLPIILCHSISTIGINLCCLLF